MLAWRSISDMPPKKLTAAQTRKIKENEARAQEKKADLAAAAKRCADLLSVRNVGPRAGVDDESHLAQRSQAPEASSCGSTSPAVPVQALALQTESKDEIAVDSGAAAEVAVEVIATAGAVGIEASGSSDGGPLAPAAGGAVPIGETELGAVAKAEDVGIEHSDGLSLEPAAGGEMPISEAGVEAAAKADDVGIEGSDGGSLAPVR